MASPLVEEPPAPNTTPAPVKEITTPVPMSSTVSEHPLTNDIIRQVEYYFSDENLPTDTHLLEKCGGRENLPVSIKSICGFKKMRQYKPFLQVVESLKKSAFLDVLPDKTIKRKIPLQCKTVLDPDFDDDESDTEHAPDASDRLQDLKTAKRASNTATQPKKPSVQPQQQPKPRGLDRPHGFEEFFADAPVTPAEHEAELSMYDPELDLRLRLEVAIQRFRSRRSMHEHFAAVFGKFMKYGGVEVTQRQFTGKLRDPDFENRDASDKALMLATYKIDVDKDDEKAWPVDFEGVAKGFLSSYWPSRCYYDGVAMERAATVLRSFYNYLLHHNVCPEHTNALYAARKVCDQTNVEFPKIIKVIELLPGEFNVSSSVLCGGYHSETLVPLTSWDNEVRDGQTRFADNPDAKARLVLTMAISTYGTEEQAEMLRKFQEKKEPMTFTGSGELAGFEVTSVEFPSSETLSLYDKLNNTVLRNKDFTVKPLGKLHAKHCDLPDFAPPDLPAWRREQIREANADKTYEFWLETEILELCYAGMKMHGKLRQTNLGVQILEQVHEVLASFYTYLPNELMATKWKQPVFLSDEEMIARIAKHDAVEEAPESPESKSG
ncbi:Argonaute siRNA chaperone complex subunit Arb1-domain-containing protein [Phyllosticta capitalensis]